MSLLLDAFKKSRQTKSDIPGDSLQSGAGLSLEGLPVGASATTGVKSEAEASEQLARNAGRNLFSAKSNISSASTIGGINEKLLIALVGTLMLLGLGAAYLWYMGVFDTNTPILPRLPPAPVIAAPSPAPKPQVQITAAKQSLDGIENSTPNKLTTVTPSSNPSTSRSVRGAERTRAKPASPQAAPVAGVKPRETESLDSLIGSAYRAYRSGNFDEARLLYVSVMDRDHQNSDALLGLGAIAQRLGEDSSAAQYYLRVLELDPRNAVANAGMSALSRSPNSESLLKGLLREQRDSAALHFALGNIYAGQSRWGDAQTAYFNAYTIDSKNAELALDLAVSLDHLGQGKMAAQYYQRALELDGNTQTHGLDHKQIEERLEELAR